MLILFYTLLLNNIHFSSCTCHGNLRLSKQRLREAKTHAVDYLILLIAGACLGSLTNADDATFGFGAYTYTIIAACKFI